MKEISVIETDRQFELRVFQLWEVFNQKLVVTFISLLIYFLYHFSILIIYILFK